jgi:hypothetical protein
MFWREPCALLISMQSTGSRRTRLFARRAYVCTPRVRLRAARTFARRTGRVMRASCKRIELIPHRPRHAAPRGQRILNSARGYTRPCREGEIETFTWIRCFSNICLNVGV